MTGALVRFGQGLAARLTGNPREGWLANGALWASLALGAVAGAAAYTRFAVNAGWIALALAAGIAAAALAIERGADQSS
jgi:uncharacterized membrane protein YoaK (UPF0700 family)